MWYGKHPDDKEINVRAECPGLTIGCLSASEIFLLYDKHIRPPNAHMSSLTRLTSFAIGSREENMIINKVKALGMVSNSVRFTIPNPALERLHIDRNVRIPIQPRMRPLLPSR